MALSDRGGVEIDLLRDTAWPAVLESKNSWENAITLTLFSGNELPSHLTLRHHLHSPLSTCLIPRIRPLNPFVMTATSTQLPIVHNLLRLAHPPLAQRSRTLYLTTSARIILPAFKKKGNCVGIWAYVFTAYVCFEIMMIFTYEILAE